MTIIIKPDVDKISSRASIRSYFVQSFSNVDKIIIDLSSVVFISRSAIHELSIIIDEFRSKNIEAEAEIRSKEVIKLSHVVSLNKRMTNHNKLNLRRYRSTEDIYKYLETV